MKLEQALIFPGQGAQYVGQGKAFFETYPAAKEIFERAESVLDLPLGRLCFEGPEAELVRTDVSQPAILVTSWAIVHALQERGRLRAEDFAATAGLSLGEYTALLFAGALELDDAVRLVRRRGCFMQAASEARPSGMASLMGLDEAQARRVCEEASSHGIVQVANLNSPGQVVISGESAALEEAQRLAKEAGARRVIPLNVAGAFHSEVMAPAAEQLARELAAVEIRKPRVPVICNVTAELASEPEEIRRRLAEQILRPVLWEASMRRCLAAGIRRFVEPGPGSVLAGLLRKIDRAAEVIGIDSPEALEAYGA